MYFVSESQERCFSTDGILFFTRCRPLPLVYSVYMFIEYIPSDEEPVILVKMGFLDAVDVDAVGFQEIVQLLLFTLQTLCIQCMMRRDCARLVSVLCPPLVTAGVSEPQSVACGGPLRGSGPDVALPCLRFSRTTPHRSNVSCTAM
ncbi:hypothetical protein DPMN_162242 [Dreissena polymorpha]|uniref:Uncharacterized protein n=1 Tax=Dreissena polymorpha TaxID=45954 RepID=A0A9D4ERX8_DREPO|nr:hypothetical protein DPMN_162242 [Dreissena polymorpha]